jgi:hypothetical protein
MSAPEPKEIREAYSDYRNEWQDIRDEAALDMRAISPNGPWDDEDRAARTDAGRPCVHLDQINQFLNQTTGNVRKSKRAVKVMPKGDGANDADAKNRSSIIMGIEERSKAQPAYLNAFQCMIERSYGFAVLRTEYKDFSSFDLEILVKPILNPDTVLLSPNYKQPDASDIPEAFLIDLILKSDFKRKYGKDAKATDFSADETNLPHISDWIKEKYIQLAEYWKLEHDRKKLLLVEFEPGHQQIILEEKWKEAGKRGEVLRDRMVEVPRVMQYMTNGLEILDEVPWDGSRIPIISCLGPERWMTEGGSAKRQLLSMVRFARDPQMLFDFLSSQECEEAGMVPKVPFVGAKGQFESDKEVWEEINKVPHAFVQYDIVLDTGSQEVLPPPQRPQWTPNFQAYELAKDSASRSLQASMGITPLPSAAARRNEKSGVALEKIDDMESMGTFHFVDRYENCFLHNMGWQINELITPILDTQREMPVTQPDGKRGLLHVVGNTSHPIDEQGQYATEGLPDGHAHTGKGEFDVTISSGPSHDSEREEQSEFVDQLIENLANLPQPGTPQAKVLALGIRMRPTLGPIGQQIADVFDPPPTDGLPPEAQAVIQPLQAQLQQLQQENAALHADRAGRVLEQQTKVHLQTLKGQQTIDAKTMDFITQIIKAELAKQSKASETQAQADADKELTILGLHHDQMDRAHDAAHEVAMAGLTHQNAIEQASQQAALQPQPDSGAQPGP